MFPSLKLTCLDSLLQCPDDNHLDLISPVARQYVEYHRRQYCSLAHIPGFTPAEYVQSIKDEDINIRRCIDIKASLSVPLLAIKRRDPELLEQTMPSGTDTWLNKAIIDSDDPGLIRGLIRITERASRVVVLTDTDSYELSMFIDAIYGAYVNRGTAKWSLNTLKELSDLLIYATNDMQAHLNPDFEAFLFSWNTVINSSSILDDQGRKHLAKSTIHSFCMQDRVSCIIKMLQSDLVSVRQVLKAIKPSGIRVKQQGLYVKATPDLPSGCRREVIQYMFPGSSATKWQCKQMMYCFLDGKDVDSLQWMADKKWFQDITDKILKNIPWISCKSNATCLRFLLNATDVKVQCFPLQSRVDLVQCCLNTGTESDIDWAMEVELPDLQEHFAYSLLRCACMAGSVAYMRHIIKTSTYVSNFNVDSLWGALSVLCSGSMSCIAEYENLCPNGWVPAEHFTCKQGNEKHLIKSLEMSDTYASIHSITYSALTEEPCLTGHLNILRRERPPEPDSRTWDGFYIALCQAIREKGESIVRAMSTLPWIDPSKINVISCGGLLDSSLAQLLLSMGCTVEGYGAYKWWTENSSLHIQSLPGLSVIVPHVPETEREEILYFAIRIMRCHPVISPLHYILHIVDNLRHLRDMDAFVATVPLLSGLPKGPFQCPT